MRITKAFMATTGFIFGIAGNAGAQWVQTTCPIANSIYSVAGSGSNIFAGTGASGGGGNGIYLSPDKGATWATANTGLSPKYIAAILISGDKILAGTKGSGVYISTNNGTSWTSAGGAGNVQAFAQSGAKVYASTSSNGVYSSDDSGKTWAAKGKPGTGEVLALALMGNKVFAGSSTGGVYVSTDEGVTWAQSNTGLSGSVLYCKAMALSGTELFVSVGGALMFKSSDSGGTWTKVSTGLSDNVYSMTVNGTDIFVGAGDGVYISTDKGAKWNKVNTGFAANPPTINALAISGGSIYAGTANLGVWTRTLADATTGISPSVNSEKYLFADVSNGKLSLGLPDKGAILNVRIFDMLGTLVSQNYTRGKIDVSGIKRGNYFVKAFDGTRDYNRKFLLK